MTNVAVKDGVSIQCTQIYLIRYVHSPRRMYKATRWLVPFVSKTTSARMMISVILAVPSPVVSRSCDKFAAPVGLFATPSRVHLLCRSFWCDWTMALRYWQAFRDIYWPRCSQFWMLPHVLCFLLVSRPTTTRRRSGSYVSCIGYE